jgi:hypothetical protein
MLSMRKLQAVGYHIGLVDILRSHNEGGKGVGTPYFSTPFCFDRRAKGAHGAVQRHYHDVSWFSELRDTGLTIFTLLIGIQPSPQRLCQGTEEPLYHLPVNHIVVSAYNHIWQNLNNSP